MRLNVPLSVVEISNPVLAESVMFPARLVALIENEAASEGWLEMVRRPAIPLTEVERAGVAITLPESETLAGLAKIDVSVILPTREGLMETPEEMRTKTGAERFAELADRMAVAAKVLLSVETSNCAGAVIVMLPCRLEALSVKERAIDARESVVSKPERLAGDAASTGVVRISPLRAMSTAAVSGVVSVRFPET